VIEIKSNNPNNFQTNYAYDLHKNVLRKGEVLDFEAINQSIEVIIGTGYGERIFNPSFGSVLPNLMFSQITKENGNALIDSLVASIKKWEDRIEIIESNIKLELLYDQNTIVITIPYVIKKNGLIGNFNKKVAL
jgi:phage baseplate assembly protein W